MKKIIIYIILCVFVLSFFPLGYSQALTIGPPKFEFLADPGDVIKGKINMRNEQDQIMTFTSSFESFTMKGGGPEPQFSGEREGLASWMETVPSVTLASGEGVSVSFTIRVPETADPGGHYAAIFWSTAPPKGGAGIGIITRLTVLVLLNISGDVIESAEVSNFKASQKFYTHLPIDFNFNFKNTGTVHLKPAGEIIVKNIFGKTTAILPVSTYGHNILPDSQMGISASWQLESKIEKVGFFADLKKELAGFHLGYYKASLNLEFGQKLEIAQADVGFWVIPWRILFLSLLILAALSFGAVKGIKAYNRWVIAKAR